MTLLGLVGAAGSGKDAVAGFLRGCGYVSLAFADPIKNFVARVWSLPPAVLWGPSELRERPILACPCGWTGVEGVPGIEDEPCCSTPDRKPIMVPDGGTQEIRGLAGSHVQPSPTPLTPRLALQRLGTEWGRALDPDVWVRMGLRRARSLQGAVHPGVGSGPLGAHRDAGGTYWPALSEVDAEGRVRGVVLTDCRFLNEAAAIRAAGGRIWRVARPPAEYVGPTVPLSVSAGWAESLALGDADRCDKGGWGSDKSHRKVWCWLLAGHGGVCQGAPERSPQWAAYRWLKGHPNPEIPPYDESWRRHASETEGASIEADLILRNDGTLDDLREKVVSALAVTQAQGAWADWETRDIDHEVEDMTP